MAGPLIASPPDGGKKKSYCHHRTDVEGKGREYEFVIIIIHLYNPKKQIVRDRKFPKEDGLYPYRRSVESSHLFYIIW
jgi:hypothetical protein